MFDTKVNYLSIQSHTFQDQERTKFSPLLYYNSDLTPLSVDHQSSRERALREPTDLDE